MEQRIARDRLDHHRRELPAQRRSIRKLFVALDLRALRADGRPAIGPFGLRERAADLRQARAVEKAGNVQQHGQNFTLKVSSAERGWPGV